MPEKIEHSIKKLKYSAVLILENGEIFWGYGLGPKRTVIAELCFNTSITGYQEILTDPSYAKQIITFTFPHIGIVGTNNNDNESIKPFASACVISEEINTSSNWRSKKNLDQWFIKNNLPCITNINTRYITKLLVKKGALKAAVINFKKINFDINKIIKEIKNWKGLENLDLASQVTTKNNYISFDAKWNNKKNRFDKNVKNNETYRIVCIDYGAKKNILRSLCQRNLEIIVVPAKSSFNKIIKLKPYGIFLSNGPGDPFATAKYAVPVIKELIKLNIPIFGICLGHQLLCLSFGAKTKKMYHGHRGANHPVQNLVSNKVEITTQNHGFEVVRSSLPKEIKETHISLFDKSNEGIEHNKLPIFSVQYHPEASPGPHDSQYLFNKFHQKIKKYAKKKRY